MRILFTLLITLFALQMYAQERTISGILTASDGSPLPGVNILIKGTEIGTTTDVNGYYSINAPVGSTLVFAFIGMATKEIVVTRDNLKSTFASGKKEKENKRLRPQAIQPIPRSLFYDTLSIKTPGVSVLTDETPSYHSPNFIDPSAVRSIKKTIRGYSIRSDNDPIKRTGFGLQFSSSISIEQINKLPSFQNQYAQGQPMNGKLNWQGAHQQEIYSWGPLLRTLEFDGTNYPFDKNGMLVPSGTGNGKEARAYDPLQFFRNGSTLVNELILTLPGPKNSSVVFDFENRNRSGVIPNSWYKRTNFSGHLKNYRMADDLFANASVSYNNSSGNLLNRGANVASIIGSVFRTPTTFDNANGLSAKTAFESPASYQLPDSTQRSHAPDVTDNPFGLVNELPDREKLHRTLGTINLRYNPQSPFEINFNGNVDSQWGENIFGIPQGYSAYLNGRLTTRKDHQTFANGIITPSYRFETENGELKASLSYQTQYTARHLNRTDEFDFNGEAVGNIMLADSTVSINKSISRTSHEIILDVQYSYSDWLTIRLGNRSYYSTTISTNKFTNIFPAASVSANIQELLSLWSIDDLRLYASISRSLRESPLLYSDWAYGSTTLQAEEFNSFFESSELFFNGNISPETEQKFETGIKFSGLNGFRIELVYFDNRTSDFIAPVGNTDGFQLQNAASIKNFGGTIAASYYRNFGSVTWGTDITWSKYNSLVQETYGTTDEIPLAGFGSIQTVLAPGKPVGAIYGSTYRRNDEGKLIIGDDGFPLEDSTPKMIGNPIPDWSFGFSSYIDWRQLRLSFLFDFKKGGDVWNGTNAALDYLGKSSATGDLRNISNYVFEGVDLHNNPNTIPVNFADPSKPVTQNRWTRYGWDGVGEDYIEDASWIRLSELSLSYTKKLYSSHTLFKQIRFSLIGHNVFLITPYTGVDPSSTLFGYGSGNGLDLFNAPSTRRYSAQITFKI